ncbi:regulatory protein, luxR family [Williamwhitmania taraxaci]|uniref:Regulatory protein, luxR family n=2 Tax=Williamwhitmania taraxaci TaxID=1640674 RepID=A0A1G6KAK7_9BACT|nr:regulatory protein, luxR family [Williamwhitmania taraxaci]
MVCEHAGDTLYLPKQARQKATIYLPAQKHFIHLTLYYCFINLPITMIKLAIIHFPERIRLDTNNKHPHRAHLFAKPPWVGTTNILAPSYTISFIDLTLPEKQEQALLRLVMRHQEVENGYLKTTHVCLESSTLEIESERDTYLNNQGKALRGLHIMCEFINSLPAAHNRELPVANLTTREKQILEFLAMGLLNKEIAEKLFISPHTVKNHTKNIYAKLGVKNRVEALRIFLAAHGS